MLLLKDTGLTLLPGASPDVGSDGIGLYTTKPTRWNSFVPLSKKETIVRAIAHKNYCFFSKRRAMQWLLIRFLFSRLSKQLCTSCKSWLEWYGHQINMDTLDRMALVGPAIS